MNKKTKEKKVKNPVNNLIELVKNACEIIKWTEYSTCNANCNLSNEFKLARKHNMQIDKLLFIVDNFSLPLNKPKKTK